MKFDTNSDMEQEEEALYYYSSNKNEIFQTQDDTLFIKPGITAYNLRVSVSTHIVGKYVEIMRIIFIWKVCG